MSLDVFIVPVLLLGLFVYAFIKKVPAYDTFSKGAKEALKMCYDIFPFLVAIFLTVQLFRISGLASLLSKLLGPVFHFLGIPSELTELMLIRPLSGSAGLTLLSEIYITYGPDSYISRCASVIMSASETIFYIAAVYFSGTKIKSLGWAIPIALLATTFGSVLGCLLLRFM